MRASKFFVSTLKEAPSEAELISHQLMLRAGLIRRLAAGIYSWLPMGVRVLRKVEAIVREEMNRAGAIEILLPVVQPGELWQESGRWEKYGQELLRFKDRHERDFVVQPTSEEVMTDIGRALLKSHKQLPVHYYQIQTKFRDERRPRFGVMRSREFIMKDGYSFHIDHADLEREYRNMYDTYTRIFTRLGLRFRAVAADNGAIGGTGSHEFQVLADSGEDAIAYCPDSDYAANVEAAEALAPATPRKAAGEAMKKVPTPGKKTCEDVVELLKLPLSQSVKALMLEHDGKLFMLLVRGDHSLNEIKASKIPGLSPFRFANESEIVTATGSAPGYIGPLGVKQVMVIADRSVAAMADFVCGANEEGFHLTGVNWGRDLPEPDLVADIRNVLAGDASPDGKGKLEICRGIEVGQVFQLRTVYSVPMKATVLDEAGQPRPMEMGCYGIGITRIVGAAIEQGHDERGIVFPVAIAPFELAIVPIGMKKSEAVKQAAEDLYAKAQAAGIDVFLDDRDERPGVMFAEMELLGIPHRIVVGDRGLKEGKLEYQGRTDTAATAVALDDAIGLVKQKLGAA